MSILIKTTVDELIEENVSCIAEPLEAPYTNINYGMRAVLGYLVKYYDENPDIMYAADHLAKLIAQVEKD